MFIEPRTHHPQKGWIEVICGSMFSGKTEELIRRLKRARIARQKIEIYKPAVDVRYDDTNVVSHDKNIVTSIPVNSSQQILLMYDQAEVVGIDEAQFFDDEIVAVAQTLAEKGVRVVVAGLDMDYRGIPFGPMPALMAIADYVTKVHAICINCGDIATHSFRKVTSENRLLLGEMESYEPRCRKCFNEGNAIK